jgi:hypothetical protein
MVNVGGVEAWRRGEVLKILGEGRERRGGDVQRSKRKRQPEKTKKSMKAQEI